MTSLDFVRCESDPCLYVKHENGEEIYVAIFVDDLLIMGSSPNIINKYKEAIGQRFKMKDLGELTNILGMSVIRDRENGIIKLSQPRYIKDILYRFGYLDCNPVVTPLDPGTKLSKEMCPTTTEEKEIADRFPYKEIVGCLMYLMVSTRPDLANAMTCLSKYMTCHGQGHHRAAIHALRYLKGTQDLGITYGRSERITPFGCCDADWAGDIDTRRSTTGYVFFMAGGPVCWKCKNQPTVALSSSESEYMSLGVAAQEAIHLRSLCQDLNVLVTEPLLIFEDNTGAIAMAANPVMHERSKHIDIKHHFIREKVAEKLITLKHLPTTLMLADLLTKPVKQPIFVKMIDTLMGNESVDLWFGKYFA